MRRRWMKSCIVVMVAVAVFCLGGCGDVDRMIRDFDADVETRYYPYSAADRVVATEDGGDCEIVVEWQPADHRYESPERYLIDIFCPGKFRLGVGLETGRRQLQEREVGEPYFRNTKWQPSYRAQDPSDDVPRFRHPNMPAEWISRCQPVDDVPADFHLPGYVILHEVSEREGQDRPALRASIFFWHSEDCMRGEIELDIKSRDAR